MGLVNSGGKTIRKILLTFDMEDFINLRSLKAYTVVLNLLEKYDLNALFFVTGHIAEKLSRFPRILKLLEPHEIGYHSSSHSVRPTIPEYTDVESYEEAYLTSIRRETAHINPLTGNVEGAGGIHFLRNLFLNKRIVAFKAPGSSWSPPHLDALRKLGIEFDFSAQTSSRPAHFKGITFYPHPITIIGFIYYPRSILVYPRLLLTLNKEITVLAGHPSFLLNSQFWDFIYYNGNPKKLFEAQPRGSFSVESLLLGFELLLKQIKLLEATGFVEIISHLSRSEENLKITKKGVERCYEKSIEWSRDFFGYKPKFLRSHFFNYFNVG